MSTDHRKPVVAFVMLALAATLVIGVQQAEAQGGRLLAAAAGAGAHVQGAIASPTESPGARDYDRLVDLGPAFVSVREVVGHADTRTMAPDTTRSRGAEPAAAGPAASPDAPTRTSPGRSTSPTATPPGRSTPGKSALAGKPGKATNGPASRKRVGHAGKASKSSSAKSSARSSSGKSRKTARRGQSRKPAAVQTTAMTWTPGKAYRSATKASPRSATAHRSARPATRPARVATTSRATGVHRSAWHHRGARGKR